MLLAIRFKLWVLIKNITVRISQICEKWRWKEKAAKNIHLIFRKRNSKTKATFNCVHLQLPISRSSFPSHQNTKKRLCTNALCRQIIIWFLKHLHVIYPLLLKKKSKIVDDIHLQLSIFSSSCRSQRNSEKRLRTSVLRRRKAAENVCSAMPYVV